MSMDTFAVEMSRQALCAVGLYVRA